MIDRGFLEQLGELSKFLPRFILAIGAELEPGVVLLFIAGITPVTAPAAAGADLPADTATSLKVVLTEILVVLLDVRVDAQPPR